LRVAREPAPKSGFIVAPAEVDQAGGVLPFAGKTPGIIEA